MKNFVKGILAGIGNITPGVSGSAMLIIFGIYEDCIKAIGSIFKNFKKSFLFLLPIGIGILIGTVLFSNIIKYLIENYPMPTTYAFTGLVAGTIPFLFKKASTNKFNSKKLLVLLISLTIGIAMTFVPELEGVANFEFNLVYIIKLVLVGGLIAASTIIPGVSSTVLLMIIGMYEVYLTAIAELQISILIPVGIGLVIGGFFLSKLIAFLLKNYHDLTFSAITGFMIGTIFELPSKMLGFNYESLISVVFLVFAFTITLYIGKISKDA